MDGDGPDDDDDDEDGLWTPRREATPPTPPPAPRRWNLPALLCITALAAWQVPRLWVCTGGSYATASRRCRPSLAGR